MIHLRQSFDIAALTGDKVLGVISDSLNEAKSWQGSFYRSVQKQLHLFAGDAFANDIAALVKEIYPRKSDRWNENCNYHRYLNVVQMMSRTLAVMAHQTPETWLEIDGERLPEDHPDMVLWRQDERDLRFGAVIRTIDRQVVRHKTLVVEPAWVKGRMQWLRWLPHNVHVLQDLGSPSDIDDAPFVHLAMPHPHNQSNPLPTLYQTWMMAGDQRRMYVHTDTGDTAVNTLFADNVVRYRGEDGKPVYPLAVWRDDETDEGEFFLPARQPWWAEQRWVCRSLMALAYGVDYQMYSIPFFRHWSGEDPSPSLDPAEPVFTTSLDADMQFKTPAPNFEAVERHIENSLRWHAVSEGLPAGIWSKDQGTKNLGSMKMDFQALNERREEHAPLYDAFVDRTWDAHKAVANYHRPDRRYSRGVRLRVRWMPIPLPRDEFQHSQTVTKRLEQGLTHQVDELMEERNIPRDEAEKVWLYNLRTNPADLARKHGIAVEEESGVQLNGAQMSTAADVAKSVAAGEIPRDTGIGLMVTVVGFTREQAETAMGSAGIKPATSTAPTPTPGPPGGAQPEDVDMPPAVPDAAAAGEGVPRPADVRDS